MITLYGIAHCDSVKQARVWLNERGVAHRFHDFKRHGLAEADLDHWLAAVGWPALLNRRGTTWRQLDAATRTALQDAAGARALVLQRPSVIKRPLLAWPDGSITLGFDASDWQRKISGTGIPDPAPASD